MSDKWKQLTAGRETFSEDWKEHPDDVPLAIHDLTVSYHRKPVIWDIDLNIPKGVLAGVIGPNGAGKSTLLKACLNLLPRTSGEVRFFGALLRDVRDRIAYVPQRESVDWDFPVTALDVVAMGTYRDIGWFRWVGHKEKKRAQDALERVGIGHLAHRQIRRLSGGQQQRVFLARALVQNADLLFLDEPFSAVDAATEQTIVGLLQMLRAEGKTCLVVHHDLATVSQYFDWLVMLNMRVVVAGSTREVFTEENLSRTYGGQLTILSHAMRALSHVGE